MKSTEETIFVGGKVSLRENLTESDFFSVCIMATFDNFKKYLGKTLQSVFLLYELKMEKMNSVDDSIGQQKFLKNKEFRIHKTMEQALTIVNSVST